MSTGAEIRRLAHGERSSELAHRRIAPCKPSDDRAQAYFAG